MLVCPFDYCAGGEIIGGEDAVDLSSELVKNGEDLFCSLRLGCSEEDCCSERFNPVLSEYLPVASFTKIMGSGPGGEKQRASAAFGEQPFGSDPSSLTILGANVRNVCAEVTIDRHDGQPSGGILGDR